MKDDGSILSESEHRTWKEHFSKKGWSLSRGGGLTKQQKITAKGWFGLAFPLSAIVLCCLAFWNSEIEKGLLWMIVAKLILDDKVRQGKQKIY